MEQPLDVNTRLQRHCNIRRVLFMDPIIHNWQKKKKMQNREKHYKSVNVGDSTSEHMNLSSFGWYQGPLTEGGLIHYK